MNVLLTRTQEIQKVHSHVFAGLADAQKYQVFFQALFSGRSSDYITEPRKRFNGVFGVVVVPRNPVTREDKANGFGDIELIPLMLGWTNGDFKYGALCAVHAPTGEYDKSQLANVGLGYWTFNPEITFSWLSSKIGTEVSVFTGVDFNTKNTEADYQSGDIFHIDATVVQHLPLFGGFAGVGANGFCIKQITGDSGSGARLGSFEVETYGVGPVLSYANKLGKHDLVCEAKWLPQLHSDNTTKGDFVWVKLALIF